MTNRATPYVFTFAALVAIACSSSPDESVGHAGTAVSNGTIYNFGTLAHPGSCMDARAAGTANGTQIQEFGCNGSGAQAFAVAAAANGAVNLVNTSAQKCVDVASAGTANGTRVQLFDCNGSAAQAFVLRGAANGFVTIVNPNSNKCLDVAADSPQDGTVVQLFDCNGTNAQLWNPAAIGVVAGGAGATPSGQCSTAQRAVCNCPNGFSCCPTDGSCFQTADQVVFTQCKNDPASTCSMGGGATPPAGGGNTGGGAGAGSGGSGAPAPGGGASPPPTCSAAKPGPGDRVITVTNQCPQTISVGVNGGFVQDCVNGACPGGTTCSTGRSPAGCFFDLPAPACGSPVLAPGASATYVLGSAPIGGIKWSGNLYASSGCAGDGTGCKTAQCVTSVNGKTVVGPCPDGTGPQGPTTLAEFTLVSGGSDFYDVSSINGVNVPVAMGPVGGAANAANPYTCGTAGGVTAAPGLQACSWSFDPAITQNGATRNEAAILRAVTPGGAPCASDAQCGGGQVCGTALALGSSAATQSCGAQVGWWTADELCAYTGNALGGPIACNQGVPGQGTNANLYGCNGPNSTSGLSATANATSCGCPDWVVNGQALTVPPGFGCHSDNPAWESVAEPYAAFLKNACPTAYSFPFDDATSTFTCTTPNPSAGNPNSVGYAITFCPGGKTGF